SKLQTNKFYIFICHNFFNAFFCRFACSIHHYICHTSTLSFLVGPTQFYIERNAINRLDAVTSFACAVPAAFLHAISSAILYLSRVLRQVSLHTLSISLQIPFSHPPY